MKPVPEDHAIRRWAADAGITDEMLQIAWIAYLPKKRRDVLEQGRFAVGE